jgi:hypothetical protein
MYIVRELRVVVRNVYKDPTKRTLWDSVSHVEKSPHRARQQGDGNQPPPPAQN